MIRLSIVSFCLAAQLAAQLPDLRYRCIGPSRGGRSTTATGVADQPGTFYMGATGGGVWKTTDYGATWRNVSDGFFDTPSVGAIRVAPSNPEIVWVGTGSDGIRSNVISGRGVYKSTDAGKTWRCVGLRDAGQIGAVEIDPGDPKRVFVAAIGQAFVANDTRGLYRTTDGGKTWRKVLAVSDTCGAVDVEFAPGDARTVYACMWRGQRKPWTIISGGREGGIFRSRDGGETWMKLEKGLPDGLFGKSDLAVSAAAPNRVWALVEAPEGKGGLYRSDDRGDSFELVSTRSALLDRPFYYCNVDVDPRNADHVFVSATAFHVSRNGGKSWRTLRTPHGDNHDLWIHPKDSNLWVQANDGGANVTRDGGKTWSTQHNQLTAELYQVAVDDRFPYWVYAGQQDNTTIRVPSVPPYSAPSGATAYWQAVGGCETGPAVPKPGDSDIVYSNCKGRFSRFNMRTGQAQQYYVGAANMYGHNPRDLKFRFQRVAPIVVSPNDPSVVYHASQYLHKTTNEGRTWQTISPDLTANEPDKQVVSGTPITRDITGEEFYSCIYAVAESRLQKGLIWVGANDGPVHVTMDGGGTWEKVTPSGLPPGGRVQTVEPSPHRAAKAYVSIYRYLLGDWQPYAFRTDDFGKTWKRLTDGRNGIPGDVPVRVVREDPNREGLLYAGTERGIFVSFDDGVSWQSMQKNLPITPITDIRVHRNDLVLSTMGRSFWILDDVTPLHQWKRSTTEARVHLYHPRDAYRLRYRSRAASPGGPEYPAPGATIDYVLGAAPDGRFELEIIAKRSGKTVRTITSRTSRPAERRSEDARMRAPRPPRSSGRTALSRKPGHHRVTWDLRHQGEPGRGGRRSRGRGPLVAPGEYELRLRCGSEVQAATLVVRPDPRVIADGVKVDDLIAQEKLALEVRATLRRARRVAERLRRGSDEQVALRKSLVTARGRYMQPMLIDQLSYLYRMITQADQRPGDDAYGRYSMLVTELEAVLDAAGPMPSEEKPKGANDKKTAWRIELRTGEHARTDTPVSMPLPRALRGQEIELTERLAGQEAPRIVPAQVLRGGATDRLFWILDGTTAAGATRHFSLRRATGEKRREASVACIDDGRAIRFESQGKLILAYNHAVVAPPKGVDPVFARSGYIHPILSADGVRVTNDFPRNHVHHHGIWFPWTKAEFRGRPVDFWNSKKRQGKVEFVALEDSGGGPVFGWLRARHRHVVLREGREPAPALDETWDVRVWAMRGYRLFDVESVQACATEYPLQLRKYRYGGLGLRGSGDWEGKGERCGFLTSEGRTRKDGHATRANWCAVYGKVGVKHAGLTVFCHPENFRAPQHMRIHPSEPFFNFAPCQAGDFAIEPGKPYRSRYRVLVFDGTPDREECARVWNDYADPPRIEITES